MRKVFFIGLFGIFLSISTFFALRMLIKANDDTYVWSYKTELQRFVDICGAPSGDIISTAQSFSTISYDNSSPINSINVNNTLLKYIANTLKLVGLVLILPARLMISVITFMFT